MRHLRGAHHARLQPRALQAALLAAILGLAILPAPAVLAQDGGPEAGSSTVAPEGWDQARQDVLDGDTYHYVRNDLVQANIMTRTGSNDQAGTFQPGWLGDFALLDDVRRETIDWSELMLAESYPTANPWNAPGAHLPLPDISVDGDAVVARGNPVIAPDIDAALTYRALPDAPVVKMELELDNAGSEDFGGYFQYLLDPDSRSDSTIVPGIGGTNPGLVESGWTANFVYDGTTSTTDEPAQGIAWWDDEPVALHAAGYIFGAWFDASVAAGETRTVTWYHVTDYAQEGNPTGNIGRWASELDLHDPDLEVQPRLSGRVADNDTAQGVPGVEVVARNIDSETVATATTQPDGTYEMILPPGTYTLTATRLGYETTSRSIQIDPGDEASQLDFEMPAVQAAAGTGKSIGGPNAEATLQDIVLENQRMAMAVSAVSEDPQLFEAMIGKPMDLAATGRGDETDWINLPWITADRPGSGDADNWQNPTVVADSVEVTESSDDQAVVTTTGAWTDNPDVEVTTTYTIEPDQPWVTARSTFTNTGAEDLDVWLGDTLDVEGSSQSWVPGTGVIPDAHDTPGTYDPTQPWIAQASGQDQVQGLLYTGSNRDFQAFGATTWLSSHFQAAIPAGGEYVLERRIVGLGTEPAQDRFAAFGSLYEDLLAEETGLAIDFAVDAETLEVDDTTTATMTLSNSGDEPITDLQVDLDLPTTLSTDDRVSQLVGIAPGEQLTETWELQAVDGGRGTVGLSVTDDQGRTVTRNVSVFVNGPGWYWGDNHSHSVYSDGSGTIAENFASARNYGLSWLTATDHNTIDQAADVAEENRDDFVALFGEEITAGDGHSLGYNIDELIDWSQSPQGRIDDTNASSDGEGFFFVAHPYYPGLEWEDWTIQDYAGIEVWNGFYPPRHAVNAQAFATWDELNRAGMKLVGLANSDAHNPGKIGSPHIRAYLPQLDDEAIWEAMRTGGFYGSDGPDLRFTMDDADIGEDVGIPAEGGTATVSIRGYADEAIDELVLLRDGEVMETWTPDGETVEQEFDLEVTPGEFYRVELVTASGRFAFTNPIWVVEGDDEPGQSDDQTITATVDDDPVPGEFVWSIDGDGSVDLGEMSDEGTHLQATGGIDPIVVTDTRAGGPSWSISGQVGDFADGLGGGHLGWTPQVLVDGAGAQPGAAVPSGIDGGDGLSVASTLASASDDHEPGSAELGADLDLRFPVDTDPGEYRATLTVTALS